VRHPEQVVEWLRSAGATIARGLGLSDTPWERVPMDVPASAFGPGSRRQFSEYLKGQSSVTASCIDDVAAWLATCEYATDLDQFNEPDVWQEPCVFEQRQRGDCEDFALWAWRKLIEIGIEAEFFVGRVACGDPSIDRQHAWVVYRQSGDAYLFEPAAHDRQRMIQPWSIVKDRYVPHFAIDHRLVTSAFVGCILDSHRPAATT
jgi:hypothetical protein